MKEIADKETWLFSTEAESGSIESGLTSKS